MKIIVTGSKGQLGIEILRQLGEDHSCELFPCDIDELDITDVEAVRSFCEPISPDVIINCAAFTAVDKCEEETDLAYKVNAIGPRNLAVIANAFDAKLVHISTDYVFDGSGVTDIGGEVRAYTEFDAIDPQSVYGASKAQGERFVQQFCSKYFIVRTAWLYGDGNNFVKTMLNLSEKHDLLKVVDDQVGSPTSTYELTKGILSIMDTEKYGIYHGTCEGRCSWYEFTKKIFEIKGIDTKVVPCTSEEFPRPAKRPAFSVLENFMYRINGGYTFSDWEVAIEKYLREM